MLSLQNQMQMEMAAKFYSSLEADRLSRAHTLSREALLTTVKTLRSPASVNFKKNAMLRVRSQN